MVLVTQRKTTQNRVASGNGQRRRRTLRVTALTARMSESTTSPTPDHPTGLSTAPGASLSTVDPGNPDDDMQWLESLPVRARLADRSSFDREAVMWRRIRPVVEQLRDMCGIGVLTDDDFTSSRVGGFCKQRYTRHVACLVGVESPARWRLCATCQGTGKKKLGIECHECLGGGYGIVHRGDAVVDEYAE
jgi:hypothetical protein